MDRRARCLAAAAGALLLRAALEAPSFVAPAWRRRPLMAALAAGLSLPAAAEERLPKGERALEDGPPADDWQALGSRGLKFIELRTGKGAEANEGSTVRVQWSGRLFSKQGWSYGRCNDPDCELRFKVGDGSTIAGLDEGIRGMREGGYRRFMIPPPIAYQEGQELQPLPNRDDMKRRLYSTVFNKVRIANGEGSTLGTIILDVVLKRVVV
ncbi:FKBP17-1 [Symbiodinium sp. CCMP2456]|nr:FKBP17-1 [Symbiodinium sp. CCMP2456]